MSRILSRGNKETELALAAVFRRHRISGWRRHVLIRVPPLPYPLLHKPVKEREFRVRPDFVFRTERVAVFVDGCFWHGCPKHCNQPANNREFWRRKLAGNRARDALVSRTLRRAGWRVVRVWEHELVRKNGARLLGRIQRALKPILNQ
jgi:DNA mismatch endonuclease (patch repair protein)